MSYRKLRLIENNNLMITLYHNTSNDNAISIYKEGIKGGMRLNVYGKGSEAEGLGIWCSTIRGYGYGGATITFQISKNDKNLVQQNDSEYILYRNVTPEEIIDIDLVVSSLSGVNTHSNTVESDIPQIIKKYGKEKVLTIYKKYSNKFIYPYNYEQLVKLIETGNKYCKGKIQMIESLLNRHLKLVEKASIDWNNYLSKDEVKQFLSKDDKTESAENIIYSKEFRKRYQDLHNDLQKKYNNSWNKLELVQDLVNFYNNGHLNTDNLKEEFINNINDESFPDELYHFTSDSAIIQILKSNMLRGVADFQVSFTSDKNYNQNGFQPPERMTAVLVIDANKLAKDYDVERFIYEETENKKDKTEYEDEHEWIVKDKVENLDKYLKYIGNNGMSDIALQQLQNNFPHIKIIKW